MASHRNRKPVPAPKARAKTVSRRAVIGGLVVVATGAAIAGLIGRGTGTGEAQAPDMQDIVFDKPFRAIHEMQAGPPIPFLATDGPQPKIVIPDSYYDFGRVGPKEVVKREFIVRNEGEAPLTISRAYTTCGCTIADFSARVIPPGKAALVVLVFDAGFHDVRGQTVKRGIIIENNDPTASKAEIWTRASVATY